MPLDLRNARFDSDEYGYPFISIEIDGIKARIFAEQKAARDGFIFLGADFEDKVPILYLPADPANGRPVPQPLHGFSDDPRLLALFQQFLAEINNSGFAPHDVMLLEVKG